MKIVWMKDSSNPDRIVWRATVGHVELAYSINGDNLTYTYGASHSIFSVGLAFAKRMVNAAGAELAALPPPRKARGESPAYTILVNHYVALRGAKG